MPATIFGERPAREDRGARHREGAEAIDQAFVQIFGDSQSGRETREGNHLDHDPGQEELDV